MDSTQPSLASLQSTQGSVTVEFGEPGPVSIKAVKGRQSFERFIPPDYFADNGTFPDDCIELAERIVARRKVPK